MDAGSSLPVLSDADVAHAIDLILGSSIQHDQAAVQHQLIPLQALFAAWALVPARTRTSCSSARTPRTSRSMRAEPLACVPNRERVVGRKLYGVIGALAVRGAWDVGGDDYFEKNKCAARLPPRRHAAAPPILSSVAAVLLGSQEQDPAASSRGRPVPAGHRAPRAKAMSLLDDALFPPCLSFASLPSFLHCISTRIALLSRFLYYTRIGSFFFYFLGMVWRILFCIFGRASCLVR
ncbi:hypothetical protein C8J57DRAFT_1516673 [Mycena rebaudengoi]|nr:hypothetical protein C8J57DRAFT_1516673 [Mycena rebaudengoi]